MSSKGIDIAWDRPTIAQIKATGASWVARYLSPDPAKNLTAGEVHDYQAADLGTVAVWEGTASRALDGYAAGQADARAAEQQRTAVGLPPDMVLHFAVDTDADWASVAPYFAGVANVIGQARTGVYGGIRVIAGAAAAGYRYLWQTIAWSGGQWSPHATIRQEGGTTLSGGADYDTAEVADFGQYPRTPGEVVPPTSPDWRRLVDHVQSIPERIYEHWVAGTGWDNVTQFGAEYGWNGVPWCAIFDWDMFHDMGLDAIVPKTAAVAELASWAQAHGQWSDYPSVGALCIFGGSVHTEVVVGFDADTVYTKGGNSIETGAADNGQGNGVWSHAHARRDAYVTGYLAPRYPDGVCPPTADPHDPRGGTAVTAWRWTASSPSPTPTPVPTPTPTPTPKPPTTAPYTPPPFPAGLHPNGSTPSAKPLQQALKATGWMAADVVESDHYGPLTQAAVAGFNARHGLNDNGVTHDPAIGPHGWALLNTLAYGH